MVRIGIDSDGISLHDLGASAQAEPAPTPCSHLKLPLICSADDATRVPRVFFALCICGMTRTQLICANPPSSDKTRRTSLPRLELRQRRLSERHLGHSLLLKHVAQADKVGALRGSSEIVRVVQRLGRVWRERVAAIRRRGGERWRWSSLARLGARGEHVGLVRGRHLPRERVNRGLLVEPAGLVLVQVRREGRRMHLEVEKMSLVCAALVLSYYERRARRRKERQRESTKSSPEGVSARELPTHIVIAGTEVPASRGADRGYHSCSLAELLPSFVPFPWTTSRLFRKTKALVENH